MRVLPPTSSRARGTQPAPPVCLSSGARTLRRSMQQAQGPGQRLGQLVVRLGAVGHEQAGEVLQEVFDLAAAPR